MKLYLDCEFSQLSTAAKLISLALVAEDGREVYVELLDSWSIEDCSDFVIEIVLPQLWGGPTPCLCWPHETPSWHSLKGSRKWWRLSQTLQNTIGSCSVSWSIQTGTGLAMCGVGLRMRPRWTRSTMVLPSPIMRCWMRGSSLACSESWASSSHLALTSHEHKFYRK